MILHHDHAPDEIRRLIHDGKIRYAGHTPGKIYGTLSCNSGKRMKKVNRVFFNSLADAKRNGFRPCGHCLPTAYAAWKKKNESLHRQR